MTDLILTKTEGRVGFIQLNRPDVLNALNLDLMAAVLQAGRDFDADPDIGCIILTGNERAFAAGADIKQMVDNSAQDMRDARYFADWELFGALNTPKIAMVQGFALGGGCEVAMLCDFIIAADSAKFGQPEIKLGIMPGIGGTQRMCKLIGTQKALEMILTGRMMDAQEAERAGLIARVFPANTVAKETLAIAKTIARFPKELTALIRQAVYHGEHTPIHEGIEWEREKFYSLFDTAVQKEGMRAFVEKRTPNFAT